MRRKHKQTHVIKPSNANTFAKAIAANLIHNHCTDIARAKDVSSKARQAEFEKLFANATPFTCSLESDKSTTIYL